MLTEKGVPIYEAAHREILRLPQALISRLGEEKCRVFAGMMKEVSDCFCELMQAVNTQRGQMAEERI